MKTTTPTLLLALFAIFNSELSTAFAQGSLTPPGAPAATMKTLSQIEPRTPISSAPFTITSRGSYYLTTNLTVSSATAININTNDVTLDLNGFTISSTEANPLGIGIGINNFPLRNIRIFNGHIRGSVTNNNGVYMGPGFATGIAGAPESTLISHVTVTGCLNEGISLSGESTTVESCTVQTVGHFGIWAATVNDCSVIDCGNDAIIADNAFNSRGESYAGLGISCLVSAMNCYGRSGSMAGIFATMTQNCWGISTNAVGLSAFTVQNSYGYSYTAAGLNANNVQNCYGICAGSDYGLYSAYTAIGCYGQSGTGIGLSAIVANNCVGSSSGTAIQATIGIGCYAVAGTNIITNKYNMP
ncbi:MAG TPA: hypothetical protein VKV04_04035 [Verrucomicrobiae bacterium]|nr:hypothetical protein [Verrucomicrobiae bacterium]